MARCENVRGCSNEATNAVPMFMGSVWMCARCSVEHELLGSEPTVATGDYVRFSIGVETFWGVVEKVTRNGWYKVRTASGRLAYRRRDDLRLV